MSFFRLGSRGDLSPPGYSYLNESSLDHRHDPFHMLDQSPHPASHPTLMLFPGSSDHLWIGDTSPSNCRLPPSQATSFCQEESTVGCFSPESDETWDETDHNPQTSPHLTLEDLQCLSREKPWERIPVGEVNTLPSQYSDLVATMKVDAFRFGPLKNLMKYYISESLFSGSSDGASLLQDTPMTNKDIVEQAAMLGLLPMAVRFHLEYTGALAMPRERKLFLQYVRGQRNRSQLRNISPASGPDINISQSSPGNQPMKYFPGIELKLGKERDSVIRPMVTSVFRAHRDEFRAALLEAGLKYGELRMWKDAQLCTAIHVADAFKPGLWNVAVDLHMKKCARKADKSRRLTVRKAITKQ